MTSARAPDRSFVGRDEVADALYRRFRELRTGYAGVTLLVGDAGVGKSALVSELVPEMRRADVRVMVGRALPLDVPLPFALLQSAIESAREDPLLRSDIDPRFGGDPALIGFVPALDSSTDPTPVGLEARLLDLLAGTADEGAKAREQRLSEMAERFLKLTNSGPTALVLEDLQNADASSLSAVEFFARELGNRPIWILGTARPPGGLALAIRERVEGFARSSGAERLVLRPFTADETAEFLRQRRGSAELSPQEVARRYSESGGNPYLLEQLERPRSLGGTGEDGNRVSPPVDAESEAVIALASILGPEFPFSLLLSASELEEERLTEAVDRLVGAGILFERSGEIIEFSRDPLREATYSGLSEPVRRALHQRAGEALETEDLRDAARVNSLARHFYLARVEEKSVRYNRLAAESAERALAPEIAWEHFSRALESQRRIEPEDLGREAELVLGLSRVLETLGVLQESEDILRDFLGRTAGDPRLSNDQRATLELFLCEVFASEGNLPATAELAQHVLSAPGLEESPLIRVGAYHHLGMACYFGGRYSEALSHHTEETRVARELGNPTILTRAQIWRAIDLEMLGDVDQAIAEAREVTAVRDRLGSARESAMAHIELADLLADGRARPSDRSDAIPEYSTAIRFAEQAKDPRRVGWALYKIAELLCEQGALEEATEKAQRSLDILRQVGDRVGLANAIKTRGRVEMQRGEFDRAEADLREALDLLEQTGDSLEVVDTHLRLCQLALLRKDKERARRLLAKLDELELPRVRPDLAAELEKLRRLPEWADLR